MRIFAILTGLIPLGIGLTTLGFLWLTPFNTFGSPPLFFRIFGSFIAFAFVLTGAASMAPAFLSKEKWKAMSEKFKHLQAMQKPGRRREHSDAGYACQHCGAPLENGSDVSPHGDVKCNHCGKWFNIH